MRPFQDDPRRTISVQWYFTDPKTPTINLPSSFGTECWELGDKWTDNPVGELQPRTYEKGQPPFPIDTGKTPCGTSNQWQFGALSTDPMPGDYPFSTVPLCCPAPPQEMTGGVAIGTINVAVRCGYCANIPNVAYVTAVNATCPVTGFVLNGVFPIRAPATCRWPIPFPFGNLMQSDVFIVGGNPVVLILACVDSPFTQYQLIAYSPSCAFGNDVCAYDVLAVDPNFCLTFHWVWPSYPGGGSLEVSL